MIGVLAIISAVATNEMIGTIAVRDAENRGVGAADTEVILWGEHWRPVSAPL